MTRKAAEEASPWQLRRHRCSQASPPWTPGPCLQHSQTCGAAINLLAWSNEHLWRFCSVWCCLLCQKHPAAPQKLPQHISGACSPSIHLKNIPGKKSRVKPTQMSGLVNSWGEVNVWYWLISVKTSCTEEKQSFKREPLAPPAPHSARNQSGTDERWIFQKWHPATVEEEPSNIWKKQHHSEFSKSFYKPFMGTRKQFLVLSSC